MAALASLGIGSGLDLNGIITKLMAVEGQPLTVLTQKEAAFQAKLSAYGSLKGVISSFQTSVSALNNQSNFKAYTATPSDSTVLTASASRISTPGSSSITVTQLAQSQTLLTSPIASTTAAIAAAGTSTTLTFQFGTITGSLTSPSSGIYAAGATFTQNAAQSTGTITISNTNNSLQGIRDSINAANMGVTASIVNNGNTTSPYNLVLTSKDTGLANSMKIIVGGAADASIANLLAYNPTSTQNLTQSTAAQNAALTVNGVPISSTSNAVTGAMTGTTLNLIKTGSTNLSVSRDTATVTASVQSLVKAYNEANTTLKDYTSYDPATKKGGILLGDSAALSIQSRIRSTLTAAITGLGSSSLTTLTQVGISFKKDGTLALDNAKLTSALANSYGDMASLFTAVGKPTDTLVSYISSTTASSELLPSKGATVGSDQGTQSVQTGSAAAGLTITGSNDEFNIAIDGGSPVSITLAQQIYASDSALATEAQTKINAALVAAGQSSKSVSVSASSGIISITSNTFGSYSAVSVTAQGSDTGNTNLLGSTPVSSTAATIATSVNDTLAVTLDGISADVTLAAGTYTPSALTGAVQSAINSTPAFAALGKSVTVSQNQGVLTITSNQPGSSSAVKITGGNAKINLLGAAPTTTATATQVSGTQPGSYNLTVSTLPTQGKSVGSDKSTQSLLTGSAAAGLTVGASNDEFNIAIDGGAIVGITLSQQVYASDSALATEAQTKINAALVAAGQSTKSVSVSASSGIISITSNTFGSTSSVSVTTQGVDTGNASLLGSSPVSSTIATINQSLQTGSTAAGLTITSSSNDNFNVSVDNGSAVSVTLTAGSYTGTTLATHIQTQINAALTAGGQSTKSVSVATDSSGKVSITSNTLGGRSSISLTTGSTSGLTNLMGSPISSTSTTVPLEVTLGDTTATVTLAAGSYTASALAAQIQSAINGTPAFSAVGKTVNVTQSSDRLTITSDSYGSTSTVSLATGAIATNLFGTSTKTSGVDASGTINGVAAIGSGQFLTGATGNASEGLKVQIIGGLTGERGKVDYSQGYAYTLNKVLGDFLNTTGSIANRTNGINKSITEIGHQRETINRRLISTEALYRKQFSSLDMLVSQMKTTGDSLTSMLQGLPSSSNTQSSKN
jgi:flagellar hook-associated protein 2